MSKGVLEPSYRRRTGYQAMLLGGMAMFASATLVLGDLRTRDDIALRRAEDLKASLSQVIPAQLHDNDLLNDSIDLTSAAQGAEPRRFYRAVKENTVQAVAFQVSSEGYGGSIVMVMGVDRQGGILGVRVIGHAETPGLGDKIEIDKDDWILSFNGHSLASTNAEQWHVRKDGGVFDQFTGATITPRAVVRAVHEGLELFQENREALLTMSDEPAKPDTATAIETSAKE